MQVETAIREALPGEARVLSDLAVRSKGHWGYSREFLDACREELSVDPARLADASYECFVAVDGDALLGYYALSALSATEYELDALFVDPPAIGRGIGRRLLEHAIDRLASRGVATLVIQGDPHAARFYEAAGARQVGTRPSGSIQGRELPLYELDIEPARGAMDNRTDA